jgi:hypothetical protein
MTAVILIVTIVANLGIALADFASAKFVLNNSAEVGVSTRWLPMLGALKAAGVGGCFSDFSVFGRSALPRRSASSRSSSAPWPRTCEPECSTTSPFRWGYLALAVASLMVLL